MIKELADKFDSYWVNGKYLLVCDDCMNVLKAMPDDSVDVVFTSPHITTAERPNGTWK